MKKIDLGQAIGILANVGVLAGIIFLAVELRQSNELMRAEARADRRGIARDAVLRGLNYPELRRARRRFAEGLELTEDELDVLELNSQAALTDFQYIYLEYWQGLLEEDAINVAGWREAFYTHNPYMPACWERAKDANYHSAFVQWMDENIAIGE